MPLPPLEAADSEKDHHDSNNLAVAVTDTGAARFMGVRIDDPAHHFQGQDDSSYRRRED